MAGLVHIRKRNEIMELENISKSFQIDIPSTIRNKIKNGNSGEATLGLFSEYCHNSSIHGVKYLGEPKRSFNERIFWISIFALSIYGCLSLIGNIWDKWQQNPVIVSFNEKSTPVWQIPFPAITICPEMKFEPDKYNFTNVILNLIIDTYNVTENENLYTDAMAHVCDYEVLNEIYDLLRNDTKMFENRSKYIDLQTIIAIFEDLFPYTDKPFAECTWQAKVNPCKSLFRKVLTKEGLCYSFNLLEAKYLYRNETVNNEAYFKESTNWFQNNVQNLDWNIEDGYLPNATKTSYPKRALASGSKTGLFLWLYGENRKWDKICRGPILGFKLLLHSPDEIDDVSSQYIQVPLGQQILISIKPKILHTADRLIKYSPQARQCFFQDERYLRYFKYYNQKNCQLECLTNFTFSKCGCVRFDMPRNNNTPVCGLQNLKCYNEAEYNLLNEEFQQGICTKKSEIFNSLTKTKCNCLPACTSIAYETEISQAVYKVKTQFESLKSSFPDNEYDDVLEMTRLFIFFKETQFLTSKRSELYGTTDFLANCGGLLSLFMGVSILSFVELIYFCTIRLAANLKMRNQNKKIANKIVMNYDANEAK